MSALQENSKRWTMKLDICAPQVIFPDDFQSGDPMLVVVDLGRILLTNCQGKQLPFYQNVQPNVPLMRFVTQLISTVFKFL